MRTTKRADKDGFEVVYYQPAHNERHPKTKKPVAVIIHNFGRSDQLDRDELVGLCRSIARVCGLIINDPFMEDSYSTNESTAGIPDDFYIPFGILMQAGRLTFHKNQNFLEIT